MKKCNLFESRYFPLVFILISFVFLLVYSFSTSPLYHYQGFDSVTFKTIGLGITQGKLPYVDLFDHKGPIIFLIDALGLSLLPGNWGIFLLQIISLSFALYFIFRTANLFIDSKRSFISVLLLLIPLLDFVVEGNACEEWMLPYISLTVYLAVSWIMKGREVSHPLKYSLFYGFSFAFLFFIRPNDAVSSIGSVMFGVFLLLMVRKSYSEAVKNALCFMAGALVPTAVLCAYYAFKGILPDVYYGMIEYNMMYAARITFKNLGVGIVLIPSIILSGLIFLSHKDENLRSLNFIFVPYIILTLILIGKRDYYHYLLPLIPYVSLLYAICLKNKLKLVVIILSVLFAGGSYMQQKLIVRNIQDGAGLKELYSQTDSLFESVPEHERNNVWNYNLYSFHNQRRGPHIHSLLAVFFNAGVTPGNKVFVPIHRESFGPEYGIEANKPQWVMVNMAALKAEEKDYFDSCYQLVASTDENCVCTIALYQRKDETEGIAQ